MGKVGTKHRDMRWEDEHGVWASELEASIFRRLSDDARIVVRRCSVEEGDTFRYSTPVRSGVCGACGSDTIVQRRTYTPDLCIYPSSDPTQSRRRYLEIKGYFPGPKRSLFRAVLKAHPDADIRLILERDGRATSSLTMLEYAHKFFKIPIHIWDGVIPRSWYEWTTDDKKVAKSGRS